MCVVPYVAVQFFNTSLSSCVVRAPLKSQPRIINEGALEKIKYSIRLGSPGIAGPGGRDATLPPRDNAGA